LAYLTEGHRRVTLRFVKRIRGPRLSPGTAIGIAALIVALGGAAFAAIPDSDGTVHACYHKTSGVLRVVEPDEGCRSSERSLTLAGSPSDRGNAASGSLKLAAGQSGVLLELGPFTFSAYCEPFGQVTRITLKSSEDNSLFGTDAAPVPAGQEREALADSSGTASGAQARWSAVTPSGVFGAGDLQWRRNVLGADCLFSANGIA
jgi:hypothetical protein